jgi:glycosyltransferase involved in cell wall biosynthesis
MTSYYLPSESKIGVGYQAHGLANALVRRGHHVTMFSPCVESGGAEYEHVHVPVRGPHRTFRWARRVAEVDASAFDALHAHGDIYYRLRASGPQVLTVYGSCFAEAIHIHGARERLRMALLGLGEVVGSLVADRAIGISANTRRWYPWIRTMIPCGVSVERFRPSAARDPEPTILFVGTYGGRKRGALLAERFAAEVKPVMPRAHLWMVCEDAPPGAVPGVEVLGRLDDDELADRYRRAWVLCLPSTYEGFGVPYIEALASGTPVVASPNPGAREVLHAGQYGLLVDDDDLGRALVALLANDARRADLSTRGVSRAAIYSWDVVAAHYEEVYRGVIRERVARTRAPLDTGSRSAGPAPDGCPPPTHSTT